MSSQMNLQSVSSIPVNSGSVDINVTWTIATPIDSRLQTTLASGANTITIPTGTTLVIIIPPTTNTQTIIAKGVTGDTGIAISPVAPTVLNVISSTVLVLTAGGSIPLTEIVFL